MYMYRSRLFLFSCRIRSVALKKERNKTHLRHHSKVTIHANLVLVFSQFLLVSLPVSCGHLLVKVFSMLIKLLPSTRNEFTERGKVNLAMCLAMTALGQTIATPVCLQKLNGLGFVEFLRVAIENAIALVAKVKVVGTERAERRQVGRVDCSSCCR